MNCLAEIVVALCSLAAPDDPRVRPGQTFVVPFPGLPQTLGGKPSELHVQMPRKYDPARKHPLLLWLNGGPGNPGIRTGMVGEDHWVVISMPLYKVNPSQGLLLLEEDTGLIWSCFRTMLAELERIVPNLHREARVVAGFSNGANCQSVLLNRIPEFRDAFRGYLLWDGGNQLTNFKALSGKALYVLYGEKSLGKAYGAPIAASASNAGADAEFVEMKGVGHDAPASYHPQIKEWIEKHVLYKDLPDAFRAMTDAVKQSRWAEAVRQYNRVSGLLVDDAREEIAPTREAFRKMSAACDEAARRLPGSAPTKATLAAWKRFATEWHPCAGADGARDAVNRYGESELASTQGQKALRKFLDEWEGFAVRRSAVDALEALAGKELDAILAKHKVPAVAGFLQKFAKDYDGTPSACKALERIQQIREDQAKAMLEQIKQLGSAAERKRAAQELIRAFDGTRAASEARGLH